MGTGGSFLRSQDDDDMLGTDLDGNGVVKRIPIEIKSRPRLGLSGLKSVGSFGKKPKGGSLRSALSVDLENPECERIRKEFELYRLERENEIGNMQKKERKLETENKRQRAELLALQKTCQKLRLERDAAMMAEQQALARAAAFESDRDKVQRQFKVSGVPVITTLIQMPLNWLSLKTHEISIFSVPCNHQYFLNNPIFMEQSMTV